ncbi:hypothetical protein WG66_003902 [Moniliophthora roreri]|nr:hypothetical protein WG66_003902 [Moniliophthora roreri]
MLLALITTGIDAGAYQRASLACMKYPERPRFSFRIIQSCERTMNICNPEDEDGQTLEYYLSKEARISLSQESAYLGTPYHAPIVAIVDSVCFPRCLMNYPEYAPGTLGDLRLVSCLPVCSRRRIQINGDSAVGRKRALGIRKGNEVGQE